MLTSELKQRFKYTVPQQDLAFFISDSCENFKIKKLYTKAAD